jgi:PAS domain S-box-containing protein
MTGASLEDRLLEAQRQVTAVLAHLPAMIGYWDRDLRNRLANAAYLDYFGKDPAHMHGVHIREVLGEDLFARNYPFMQAALAGEPQLFDRTIVTPTGETRHTQASYIPDVVDGTVEGFFVLVTDITARKQAEEALRRAHAELEEKAKALAQANADLETFAAAAAHDLRNPLVLVSGYADLLASTPAAAAPDAAEMVDAIKRSAVRGMQLIDELLAFSGLGAQQLAVQEVDLTTLAREAEAVVTHAGAVCQVEVADLPTALADPALLRQVFVNLIGNGAKYVAPGVTPRVRVEGEAAGEQVVVRVSDNGIGIPEAERDTVFEVFRRGSQSAPFSGTGVGLAICQRIVELHQGRIWIEDAPGGGTTFCFTLPSTSTSLDGTAPAP